MTLRPKSSDWPRRRVLQGTALGAAAVPAAGLLSSCATSGEDETEEVTNSGDPDNPFEVDGSQPLDVVVFDGGFGTEYADEHVALYAEKFSDSEATMTAEQDIAGTQQARFADGSPPDLLDNSGADAIALDGLVKDELLAELTPLLEAPSVDDPDVTVAETLVPGSLKQGTFADPNGGGEKVFALPYVIEGWAVWYNDALLKEKDWPVPATWEEMLDLCEEIKKDGLAPWTYAGKHSTYLWDMLFTLASREAGRDLSVQIDNLEPNIWSHDSMVHAAEALYSLQDKGYILEGTPGIDHIESQTKWNHGEAVFLPCGSWLANEQGDEAPDDFVYNCMGVPAFEGSKQPDLIWQSGGEPFVVPSAAANKPGAFEHLRIMLSRKGSETFAEATRSPSILADQEIDDEAAKALADLAKGEEDMYRPQIVDWYSNFKSKVEPVLGELMAGEMKPEDFLDQAQSVADEIAQDDDIDKFKQSY